MPSEFLQRMAMLAEHIRERELGDGGAGRGFAGDHSAVASGDEASSGNDSGAAAGTIATAAFHLHVETIGSKFGGIPQGFPHFEIPQFHAAHIIPLLPSVFTVALLAAIESLLSAVVADSMSGDRHNSNVELVAQGIANIFSPLFGGIPATGAIARTATNIRSGARTPVAGMVHALTLLVILLVAAPLARFVPLATLAAVLFVVAYNMGEWREIGGILRLSKTDIAVWAVTFALTVFADLTVAVGVGMALAALLYIHRVSETTFGCAGDRGISARRAGARSAGQGDPGECDDLAHSRAVSLWHHGEADRCDSASGRICAGRHCAAAQYDGDRCDRRSCAGAVCGTAAEAGKTLVFCGARDQPRKLLSRTEFLKRVGPENFLPHVQAALARAREINGEFEKNW